MQRTIKECANILEKRLNKKEPNNQTTQILESANSGDSKAFEKKLMEYEHEKALHSRWEQIIEDNFRSVEYKVDTHGNLVNAFIYDIDDYVISDGESMTVKDIAETLYYYVLNKNLPLEDNWFVEHSDNVIEFGFEFEDEAHDIMPYVNLVESVEEDEEINEEEMSEDNDEEDPCWDGYEQYGMKDRDGEEVPNCIPVKESKQVVNESHYVDLTDRISEINPKLGSLDTLSLNKVIASFFVKEGYIDTVSVDYDKIRPTIGFYLEDEDIDIDELAKRIGFFYINEDKKLMESSWSITELMDYLEFKTPNIVDKSQSQIEEMFKRHLLSYGYITQPDVSSEEVMKGIEQAIDDEDIISVGDSIIELYNLAGGELAMNKNIKKASEEKTKVLEDDELTDQQKKDLEDKREEILKGLKDDEREFKQRYGKKWKSVMYGTATNMAKEELGLTETAGDVDHTDFIHVESKGDYMAIAECEGKKKKMKVKAESFSEAEEKAKKYCEKKKYKFKEVYECREDHSKR